MAILDTGIDLDHPDLVDNIEGGYGAIQAGSFDDDHNHGTHVAGIVAAAANNDIGVVGVAPAADLWAVKVLDQNGGGYLSDIVEGIRWAIDTRSDGNLDNDIQVINMSFGTTYDVWLLEDAIVDAESAGIVLVAAAGNNGPSEGTVLYPAAYPSVVAVGATDQQDLVASFSSRGSQVELCAPGVSIVATVATGGYQAYSGTSMASPHVSGAAALILQADPSATPVEVVVSLAAHAEDLGPYGRDSSYGFGLVRPDRSLDALTPPEPNMSPVAVDDSATTGEDTAVVVDVLANDSDLDGDLLTVTSVTDPAHGMAFADPSGTVTYSPDVNYHGSDIVDYVLSDSNGGTDTGTVTIEVTGTQANFMHVARIEMDIKKAGRNVSALATVTIVDALGNPVAGAVVSGVWSESASDQDSGVTEVAGQVTFQSNKTKDKSATFIFTVTNVVLDGWTYDSSAKWVLSGTVTYP